MPKSYKVYVFHVLLMHTSCLPQRSSTSWLRTALNDILVEETDICLYILYDFIKLNILPVLYSILLEIDLEQVHNYFDLLQLRMQRVLQVYPKILSHLILVPYLRLFSHLDQSLKQNSILITNT